MASKLTQFKKIIAILLSSLGLILSFSLIADTVIYPGFSKNVIGVDSQIFLLFYLLVALPAASVVTFLPKNINSINSKYVFPILLLILSVLFTLEISNFPNYVFSVLHIDLKHLAYLTILSGAFSYIFYKDFAPKHPHFYILPPFTLMLMFIIVMVSPKLFIFIVQEDGIAEYSQFLFYLISAIFAFKISRFYKTQKAYSLIFFVISLGLFFIAFEEISWGQRILGIQTPETFKEHNHQDEINFHNLHFFQQNYLHLSFVIAGFYGAFARKVVLILPLSETTRKRLMIFTPQEYLFFNFFAPFVLYAIYNSVLVPNEVSVGNVPLGRWQEVFEIYLALGFMGYTRDNYILLRETKNKSS